MAEINFGAREASLSLKRALLIYGGGGDKCLVTDHPVDDGIIQPGKPLNLQSLKALLEQKGEATKSDITWCFPRLMAETPEWNIWWAPAGVRSIFIAGKAEKAWFPTLIFAGHRSLRSLFCWATPNAEPSQRCDVYRPVFSHHIFGDGGVCLGSTPAKGNTPAEWEAGFFESSFQDNINLKPDPYDITKTFKKIGTLEGVAATVSSHRKFAN